MIWNEILLVIAHIDGPGDVVCPNFLFGFDFYAGFWCRLKRKLPVEISHRSIKQRLLNDAYPHKYLA